MHDVHLGSVDLNLLVALDALLSERNVTRAAERVGLSQSAMSHSLARLRRLLDDDVLVRGVGGMVPTARAEALVVPIRHALEEVAQALAPSTFEPATARGKVVLATSDYAELVLLPTIAARVAREAPGIDLRLVLLGDDGVGPLAAGSFDLAISPHGYLDAAGLVGRHLFDDSFVCVVRKGHPLAKKKLTLQRFTAARHALIAPRGREGGFVDEALQRLGLERRVAVAVPHFLSAPHVVASSDLVLTLAARVANVVARPLGLAILAPPSELGLVGFRMSLVWHERSQRSPMLTWMRDLIAKVAQAT